MIEPVVQSNSDLRRLNLEHNQDNIRQQENRDVANEQERQVQRRADEQESERRDLRTNFNRDVIEANQQERRQDSRESQQEDTDNRVRAEQENRANSARENLELLRDINDRQSSLISAQARQDLLRDFSEVQSRLRNENGIQNQNFNPNNPIQTLEAIEEELLAIAEEVIVIAQIFENSQENEQQNRQAQLAVEQAIINQERERAQVFGPRGPEEVENELQREIGAERQRENPFGQIT